LNEGEDEGVEGSDREGDGTALISGRKGSGRAGEDSTKVTPPPHGIALERVNQRIQLYAYRNDDGLIGIYIYIYIYICIYIYI
jgi:hypothetical protein